jgi:hypothetical protein
MRVVRNIGYIKSRRRAGRIMVALGMLILAVSLAILFSSPGLVIFGMVLTIVGYFFFFGGLQQVARWGRKNRNDELLDNALSRLSDRNYALIHYADFDGRRPDHILVTPARLLVITAREIGGRVRVKGRSWRKGGLMLASLFNLGGPQLGNPTLENEQQVEALREFLQAEGLPGDVEGAVVFVNPLVEVEVVETSVPVLHVTELFDYVRAPGDEVTLSARDRDLLIEKLARGKELERAGSTITPPKKRARAV